MGHDNPYDWSTHRPAASVPRGDVFPRALRLLRAGGRGILLGGRGMGKSVFLYQLQQHLAKEPDLKVVLCGAPPVPPTFEATVGMIADALEMTVPPGRRLDMGALIQRYLEDHRHLRAVVLLFDEMDGYALKEQGVPLGRLLFNHLETASRDLSGRLRVFAAGGLGVFALRDLLGSGFLSRAARLILRPFSMAEADALAAPFGERGQPLTEEVRQAVYLASGGIPALVTYALQHLWERAVPGTLDVAEIFAEFQELHKDFLRDAQRSIAHPALSDVPSRVLDLIRRSDGRVSRQELLAAGFAPEKMSLDPEDALDLLQAAGLIRVEGSAHADPVTVRPLASILNVPRSERLANSLRQQLLLDLERLLGRIHALAPDFFRPGASGRKELVPESVFSAFVAMGLEFADWVTDREAQQGAGRTDIKLRHARLPGVAVIELKIWGRNDFRQAHAQVTSYVTAEVEAAAVVMISDARIAQWPDRYLQECLDGLVVNLEQPAPGLCGHLSVTREGQGMAAPVDHLLLQLPSR